MKTITYTFTGEHRQPKPGEWYLWSGGTGEWSGGWTVENPPPHMEVDILVGAGVINEDTD